MYCQINPKLFKPFQSRKKIIEPKLSDDWEILPETYNSSSDITVYSPKLNVKVAGFEVYNFLRFLKNYNVELKGLKIKGEFIPGQDRKLYSKEDYEKWLKKYGSIVDGKVSLRSITEDKIGKKYMFKCGATYYFMGFIYKNGKKVRLFGNCEDDFCDFVIISNGQKLSQELNETISVDKLEYLWARAFQKFDYVMQRNNLDFGNFKYEKWYDKEQGLLDSRFFNPEKDIKRNYYCKSKKSAKFVGFIDKKLVYEYEFENKVLNVRYAGVALEELFCMEWKFENNKLWWKLNPRQSLYSTGAKRLKEMGDYKDLYNQYCVNFMPFEYDIYYKKKELK